MPQRIPRLILALVVLLLRGLSVKPPHVSMQDVLRYVVPRLATEFENAGYNLPLPQKFKKFAKNKGASLFTAGAITYMSTAFALANATPVDQKPIFPPPL